MRHRTMIVLILAVALAGLTAGAASTDTEPTKQTSTGPPGDDPWPRCTPPPVSPCLFPLPCVIECPQAAKVDPQ